MVRFLSAFLSLCLAFTSSAPAVLAQSEKEPPPRRGFWIGLGFGYGSLTCEGCDASEGGFSGTLRLGGTLSQKVRLGVSTNGWYKSEEGVTLSQGNLSGMVMWFPSTTSGFHLTGGLGISILSLDLSGYGSDSETGAGAILGIGYEAMVGRSFALVPYLNFVSGSFDGGWAGFWQLGLAATWP